MLVRLSINTPKENVLRHIPRSQIKSLGFDLVVNEHVERPDYWFVYSKGRDIEERSVIPRSNVIFIAGEPEYIYSYSKNFLEQFGLLLGPRNDLSKHNGAFRRSYPAQPWLVGRSFEINEDNTDAKFLNWSYFSNYEKKPINNKISVVVSNKSLCLGHLQRNRFVRKLIEHFGERVDVFGGNKPFSDKWDAVSNYKYHIAIENGSVTDYWTEKISDALLAECFVFYAGCKNIEEYFDMGSVEVLDIGNFAHSVNRIENALANDFFFKSTVSRVANKQLILNEYNLISFLKKIIDEVPVGTRNEEVIIPREKQVQDFGKFKMKIRYNLYNRILKNIV